MSDVTKKTTSELLDQLITTDIKCFMAQEKISSPDDHICAAASRMAQQMNKRRCDLMRAIDHRLGEGDNTVSEKTY